jgi:acetolactate synthase-1/2/3 large subunit
VGGSACCDAVREAFRRADVVLAVGTEFSETDHDLPWNETLEIGGELIRVDIDADQLSRNLQPQLAICSDAREAAAALCAALGQDPPADRGGRAWAQDLRDALHGDRDARYQAFFDAIDEALPGVIIAGDSTQPTYYAWMHYETQLPRRYFHSASGFGTLGYAIPAAIGAKLARPACPVVALIGDGGAQFSLGEIGSAVEAGVSPIFVVWSNQGYGEIRHFFRQQGVERIGVGLHDLDFVSLARSFGCSACRAADLDEFKRALRGANRETGPTLIEVQQSDFSDEDAAL